MKMKKTSRGEYYDVVVAGGGLSGTMAAIAASRRGCKTLLVERYAALGGMATSGLVQPITNWGIGGRLVIGGTGRKILEEIHRRNPRAATAMSPYGPTCDAEYLKYVLEKKAGESNVSLLYHTWVTGVEKSRNAIRALKLYSKSGPGRAAGSIFIDATGDADLAALAGVKVNTGTQGITLMMIISGIERAKCPDREKMKEIWRKHKRNVSYRQLCFFWHPRPGTAYFNMTEVEGLDGLSAPQLTRATVECRRQAWRILEVFRAHVPGFENAYIEQTAPAIGVRETRHIRGLYTLTADDVVRAREFDDVIARAASPLDIHGRRKGGRHKYEKLERSYAIPYRCLVTGAVRNLVVTGRPISADRVAHASLRRMAPGMALGEAAGTAASLAVSTGDVRNIDIKILQNILRRCGTILDPEPKN